MHPDIASRIADLTGQAPDHQPVTVTIDGRSGAGKSSLAQRLATRDTLIIEVEMLAAGWHDLAGAVRRAGRLIADLRRGPACVRWWNWHAKAWNDPVIVEPRPIIILVGCGAGQVKADLAIWLEAGEQIRKARAMARDDGTWEEYWQAWADQETELLAGYDAAAGADIIISTGA